MTTQPEPGEQPDSYVHYPPLDADTGGPDLPAGYRLANDVPTRGRRRGRLIGVAIAAVAAIGVGTGAYFVFWHQGAVPPDQVASGFAQSYTSLAHSMSAADLAKVKTYLCTSDQQAVDAIYQRAKTGHGTDASFTMTASNTRTNGDAGSFTLTIVDQGAAPVNGTGNLVRQQNQWLVCHTMSG